MVLGHRQVDVAVAVERLAVDVPAGERLAAADLHGHELARVGVLDHRPAVADGLHRRLDAARRITAPRLVAGPVEDQHPRRTGGERSLDHRAHHLRVGVGPLFRAAVPADVGLDHHPVARADKGGHAAERLEHLRHQGGVVGGAGHADQRRRSLGGHGRGGDGETGQGQADPGRPEQNVADELASVHGNLLADGDQADSGADSHGRTRVDSIPVPVRKDNAIRPTAAPARPAGLAGQQRTGRSGNAQHFGRLSRIGGCVPFFSRLSAQSGRLRVANFPVRGEYPCVRRPGRVPAPFCRKPFHG